MTFEVWVMIGILATAFANILLTVARSVILLF
jgi:hypothetical protein